MTAESLQQRGREVLKEARALSGSPPPPEWTEPGRSSSLHWVEVGKNQKPPPPFLPGIQQGSQYHCLAPLRSSQPKGTPKRKKEKGRIIHWAPGFLSSAKCPATLWPSNPEHLGETDALQSEMRSKPSSVPAHLSIQPSHHTDLPLFCAKMLSDSNNTHNSIQTKAAAGGKQARS